MPGDMTHSNQMQAKAAKFTSAHAHVAVVAEGGGQRGIFTAGVLDAFLDQQFNPFELGLGVSAGAQNLLSYFLGEKGYARRVISELTAAPGFYVPYRWLGTRGVIDLDKYFEQTVENPEYRLPYKKLSNVQTSRKLIFVATHSDSLRPVYLEPNKHTVINHLKASSAVPLLYKSRVTVDQQNLVDGGVADPLPVQKAVDMGARQIVVIRTAISDAQRSSWSQRVDAMPIRRALPSKWLAMLKVHDKSYKAALELMRQPPAGVDVISIAPKVALLSHAFGSSSEAIVADYETGLAEGHRAVKQLQTWLSKQKEKNLRKLKQPTLTP